MQPFPKWVSWIFVCLLAYIIYTGNQSQRPPASTPKETAPMATETATARDFESLHQLTDGNRWMRAINPNYVGEANIKEITIGEGPAVACGTQIEVLLRGTTHDGANFDPAHDESKPLTFTVGEAPIEALNEGLIGMKQGGVRLLSAPAKQVYKDLEKRNFNDIQFNLTLSKVTGLTSTALPATSVTVVAGKDTAEPVRCGTTLRAHLRIFDDAGHRIYDSKTPLEITLGQHALGEGVDMLARGMRMGEERLLYIPPHYATLSTKADPSLANARTHLSAKTLRIVQMTRVE